MTGSALSLYLEETKTDEDSMFQPEISPMKKEGVAESQGNLNSLTGAREKLARGQGEPAGVPSTNFTTLALHKVASSVVKPHGMKCTCAHQQSKFGALSHVFSSVSMLELERLNK